MVQNSTTVCLLNYVIVFVCWFHCTAKQQLENLMVLLILPPSFMMPHWSSIISMQKHWRFIKTTNINGSDLRKSHYCSSRLVDYLRLVWSSAQAHACEHLYFCSGFMRWGELWTPSNRKEENIKKAFIDWKLESWWHRKISQMVTSFLC